MLPPVPPVSATTVSPSESPSPSATPSAAPDSKAAERAAVEAAVRFYYDGYERSIKTGDAEELARGSTENCTCRRAVEGTRKLLALGKVTGNAVSVTALRVVGINGNIAYAQVTTSNPDGTVTTPDGRQLPVPGEGVSTKAVVLLKQEGVWKVDRVTRL